MIGDPTSLESLHDIIAPAPVPFWPPAQGWWWVFAFLLVGGVIGLGCAILWWQQNRYRREALKEWRKYDALLTSGTHRLGAITGLATLMKRVALSEFPRERVASLTGNAWLEFLRQSGGAEQTGQWLEQVSYNPRIAEGMDVRKAQEISAQVEAWIRCSGGQRPSLKSPAIPKAQNSSQRRS